MTSPLLTATNLTFAYKDSLILQDLTLSIPPNSITTIIGPNGGGKSTLLKLLTGLIPPTSGVIWRQPHLRIGYMPQSLQVPDLLPMGVNQLLRLYSPNPRQDISQILEEVGIAHLNNRQFHTLSGGEKQRTLLAQALLSEPHLLILDEPVQNVDLTGQAALYQLIERIAKIRQCAVVLVSHDLHFVLASSDHVVCLNKHICCAGHPHTVQQDQAYKELFGNMPLVPYIHHHDHHHGD